MRCADHSFRGVLPSVCVCVWHIKLQRSRPRAELGHWATNTEQSVGLSTDIISLYQNFCRCNTTSVSVHIHLVNKRYAIYIYIQGVPGGMFQTSGECSLC